MIASGVAQDDELEKAFGGLELKFEQKVEMLTNF